MPSSDSAYRTSDLVVVRILLVHLRHHVRVRDVARELVAGAEIEHVLRLEERLLLRQLGLGQPRLVRRRQPLEHRLRLVEVLLRPQRMVVAHRLAPVGHRELRVGGLRLLERHGRLVELEVVQGLHAREEGVLRGGCARGGKRDRPELLRGRLRRQDEHRRHSHHDRRRRAHTNHGVLRRIGAGCASRRAIG